MTNRKKCDIIIMLSVDGMLGGLAQLGEHLPYKQRVTGSSPVPPTTGFDTGYESTHGAISVCAFFEEINSIKIFFSSRKPGAVIECIINVKNK